jgi:hypothetical protein
MSLISALFGMFLHQAYVKVPDGYQIDLGDGKLVLRYDSERRSIAPSGNAVILRMQWDFD